MTKRALITGITGQDGSWLSELLIGKGYDVHGIIRRSSSFNTGRIDHIFDKLSLHYGDTTDASSINMIMQKVMPNEIYHLAAQSHVGLSFEIPDYTANVDGVGTLRVLDAIKNHVPGARFYNAATSELFGKVQETPQKETTPFYPRSPYGAAKLYAYWVTINYREAYGLFACNGILMNHESERRGETFVTRKITRAVGRIKHGLQDKVLLGNLAARRDWGYAPEYCEGMWRMLQQDKPDDILLATGETHSVEEFCSCAFKYAGMPLEFEGQGTERVGRDTKGKIRVAVNPRYYRPTEVDLLLGDPSKAAERLGWKAKVKFEELVRIMTAHDIAILE